MKCDKHMRGMKCEKCGNERVYAKRVWKYLFGECRVCNCKFVAVLEKIRYTSRNIGNCVE